MCKVKYILYFKITKLLFNNPSKFSMDSEPCREIPAQQYITLNTKHHYGLNVKMLNYYIYYINELILKK